MPRRAALNGAVSSSRGLTASKVPNLSLPELRKHLEKAGLENDGKRADMVKRLQNHIRYTLKERPMQMVVQKYDLCDYEEVEEGDEEDKMDVDNDDEPGCMSSGDENDEMKIEAQLEKMYPEADNGDDEYSDPDGNKSQERVKRRAEKFGTVEKRPKRYSLAPGFKKGLKPTGNKGKGRKNAVKRGARKKQPMKGKGHQSRKPARKGRKKN